MKSTFCVFSDGRNEGMVAETWCERVKFYFMALFNPVRYRLGTANGKFCLWIIPESRGEKS